MPLARDDDARFETISERTRRLIDEAAAEGFFDNLPNQGQPLDLSDEDNPFIPEDMRLAYRILRSAGYALPWIELRKEIEARRTLLDQQAASFARETGASVARIRRLPAYLRSSRWRQLHERHARFLRQHGAQIDELNRKILDFNISVPVVSLQVVPVNRDRRLAELAALLPRQPE